MDTSVPAREKVIALLGAPLAWTLHLFISYVAVAVACNTGWRAVPALVTVFTVILTLLSIGAGVFALNRWRRVQHARSWEHAVDEAGGTDGLFMLVGVMQAAIFTPLIVMNGVAAFLVPLCPP